MTEVFEQLKPKKLPHEHLRDIAWTVLVILLAFGGGWIIKCVIAGMIHR